MRGRIPIVLEAFETAEVDDFLVRALALDFADKIIRAPPPDPNQPHKLCRACGRLKPLSEYHRANRPTPDGLSHRCRTCHSFAARDENKHGRQRPK